MIQKLNLIGAGGFGREVISMLSHCQRELVKVYDDKADISGIDGVINDIKANGVPYLISIGSSVDRRKVFERLPENIQYDTLIHPRAFLQDAESINIGRGSIITTGNIFTCDITFGEFCIINLNCTIGHGVKMGKFCSLMPSVNLGGQVTLEDEVYIGTGVTVLPGVHIGKGALIGAGAVVTKNVEDFSVMVGVPARPLKRDD